MRNSPDGVSWNSPAEPVDTVPRGHRFFPDIASADRRLAVVFQDPRADPSYPSLSLLPRGNTATGQNSGAVVRTFVASSANGGRSWSELQVSTAGSNPNWEVRASPAACSSATTTYAAVTQIRSYGACSGYPSPPSP